MGKRSRRKGFPFLSLLPELQGEIIKMFNVSDSMCLHLTCKKLYQRPTRPNITFTEFAQDIMRCGHEAQRQFAIDKLGMSAGEFRERGPNLHNYCDEQSVANRLRGCNFDTYLSLKPEIYESLSSYPPPHNQYILSVITNGDNAIFQDFVRTVVPVNADNINIFLEYASNLGRIVFLEYLMPAPISPLHVDTVLKYAIKGHQMVVLDFLLEKGCIWENLYESVLAVLCQTLMESEYGTLNTVIAYMDTRKLPYVLSDFFRYVYYANLELLKRFVKKGFVLSPSDINIESRQLTPSHEEADRISYIVANTSFTPELFVKLILSIDTPGAILDRCFELLSDKTYHSALSRYFTKTGKYYYCSFTVRTARLIRLLKHFPFKCAPLQYMCADMSIKALNSLSTDICIFIFQHAIKNTIHEPDFLRTMAETHHAQDFKLRCCQIVHV